MESYKVTKIGQEFQINGVPPDAVKAVKIDGPKAKRLADLGLHKIDLEFAANCLNAINHTTGISQQALWRNAVIYFIKCFDGASARFQLSEKKILKGEAVLAMENFHYFHNLRRKHFVHDENSYSQSIPGALLNNGEKEYKIEKIVCFSAIAETLVQDKWSNLDLLIKKTRAWVEDEMDKLCGLLTSELEKESYEDLWKREQIVYKTPGVEDISKKRDTI